MPILRPRRIVGLIAAASLTLVVSPAAAATVATPPVLVPSTSWSLVCTWTNIGTKPLEGVVNRIVDPAGAVIGSSNPSPIAPGQTFSQSVSGTNVVGFFHCSATNVPKSKVILTACVRLNSGGPCTPVVVAP
jgi:hypothetical protein